MTCSTGLCPTEVDSMHSRRKVRSLLHATSQYVTLRCLSAPYASLLHARQLSPPDTRHCHAILDSTPVDGNIRQASSRPTRHAREPRITVLDTAYRSCMHGSDKHRPTVCVTLLHGAGEDRTQVLGTEPYRNRGRFPPALHETLRDRRALLDSPGCWTERCSAAFTAACKPPDSLRCLAPHSGRRQDSTIED